MALLASEADHDELYAAALGAGAGVTRMEAGRQLEALRRAGLLAPAGHRRTTGPGRPPALYRRIDVQGWSGIAALGARYRLPPDNEQAHPG